MKSIIFLVMIMISVYGVQAQKIYITEVTHFDLGNGANITILPNQTLDDNISLQPNSQPILHIRINGSEMKYSTISDKTLSNITYNFTKDKFEFDGVGVSDPLNMTATMKKYNVSYNFSVDALFLTSNTSDADKQVSFSFDNWSQHNFVIEINSTSIILYSVSGYVINKFNDSLYNVNVTIENLAYIHTDIDGYYNLDNLESGSYTIKAILYPYSNKTANFEIINDSISYFNITMSAQSGGRVYNTNYTPIFALIFMISVIMIYATRSGKRGKNNEKSL